MTFLWLPFVVCNPTNGQPIPNFYKCFLYIDCWLWHFISKIFYKIQIAIFWNCCKIDRWKNKVFTCNTMQIASQFARNDRKIAHAWSKCPWSSLLWVSKNLINGVWMNYKLWIKSWVLEYIIENARILKVLKCLRQINWSHYTLKDLQCLSISNEIHIRCRKNALETWLMKKMPISDWNG